MNLPGKPLSSLSYPVLMASHDAGGAELLAAWLAHTTSCESIYSQNFSFALEGPAITIFQRYFPDLKIHSSDNLDVSLFSQLLVSTSDVHIPLERHLLFLAKKNAVNSIGILDYWKNYECRFQYQDTSVLPDTLWVFDEYAQVLAEKVFPESTIVLQQNYYISDQVSKIQKLEGTTSAKENNTGINVLYVCEPSYDERYSEYDAINLAIEYLQGLQCNIRLRLRLHPREQSGKYNDFLATIAEPLHTETSLQTLFEDIAWADKVIGCQTMAMVVALAAKKEVLSSMPACVDSIALPHAGIQRISDMLL